MKANATLLALIDCNMLSPNYVKERATEAIALHNFQVYISMYEFVTLQLLPSDCIGVSFGEREAQYW